MVMEKRNPNRIGKVNALIQKLLGEILRPYLEGQESLVTISKVESSRDLRWAKVWVSVLGGSDKAALSAVQKNLYTIQGELNRKLKMKIVPRLQFFLDTAPRYVQHIDELINEIHEGTNNLKLKNQNEK